MIRVIAAALVLMFPGVHTTASPAEIIYQSAESIRDGSHTLPSDVSISTAQPDEQMLQIAADSGFVAVVDLRTAREDRGIDEATIVESLGMQYVSLPIGGPDGFSDKNAAALEQILAGLEGPALLHCASGNRVGALVALSAKSHGADVEAAIAAGKAAGLSRSEDAIRKILTAD